MYQSNTSHVKQFEISKYDIASERKIRSWNFRTEDTDRNGTIRNRRYRLKQNNTSYSILSELNIFSKPDKTRPDRSIITISGHSFS
ncbi:unnamed protein product [Rhizophagus irregularis]|nr:unnamed protein product [Rhizophagus irregularis]CAB5393112.1 unnamed protein product [Rhizophagus irregularis]